jgi:hypothetical protein
MPGSMRRRRRREVETVIASASEAIHRATKRKNGLLPPSLVSYGGQVVAEFIIRPAEGGTGWLLAMTVLGFVAAKCQTLATKDCAFTVDFR